MTTIWFFLLCSGLFQLTVENHLRSFSNLTEEETFDVVRRKCSDSSEFMPTIYDEDDVKFLLSLISTKGDDHSLICLGLRKNSYTVNTWSNGDPVTFNDSTVQIEPGQQKCEAIENGTWKGFNCSERKYFMCQTGKKYTLINQKKSWCQALQHCRGHFKDLASIDDTKQNEELKNKSLNRSFWIGLRHDEWEWADKGCSAYRNIGSPSDECLSISIYQSTVKTQSCEMRCVTFCSKGSVRIKLVQMNATWEEALEYCEAHHTRLLWIEDQDDQNAVEQWLSNTDIPQPTDSLWIGLKQSSIFGFWIWSDRIVNWSNWKDGEPPDLHPLYQCGVINTTSYKWSNGNCLQKQPFLCEEDILYMD